MRLFEFDLVDIAAHAAVAAAFGLGCALVATISMSLAWAILAILSAGWLVRELSQHEWQFGGVQSQLEWIVPVVVQVGVFALLAS